MTRTPLLTSPPARSHATPKAAATTGTALPRVFLGALPCGAQLATGKQGRAQSIFSNNGIFVSDTEVEVGMSSLNPAARGISVSSATSFMLLNCK